AVAEQHDRRIRRPADGRAQCVTERLVGDGLAGDLVFLEEFADAGRDRVHASLVIRAAVDVHDVFEQRQHRALLAAKPFDDFAFAVLGHVCSLYLSFGSSASRSPSPSRLNDSTVRKMARPGHTAIHGAVVRKRCAELSIEPQDGAGGCCPSPRNESAASAMMAAAIESVACTSSAGRMFGRMWNRAMRQGGLPMARAAST